MLYILAYRKLSSSDHLSLAKELCGCLLMHFFYKVDKPEDPPGCFPGTPGDVEMI
jgi:hypothetical protein